MRFRKEMSVGFRWLWAVIDLDPNKKSGRLVVFDPQEHSYGIATKSTGKLYGKIVPLGLQ